MQSLLRTVCPAVVAGLLGLGLALLAPRAVGAQDCTGAECSSLRFTVTSPATEFEVSSRILYSLTLRNTGTHRFERLNLRLSANAKGTGLVQTCAAANNGWTWTTSPNSESWRRTVGPLSPGQSLTVPFCLYVQTAGSPGGPCTFAQQFVVQTEAPNSVLEDAYMVHRQRGCPRFVCNPDSQAETPCCVAEALHCLLQPGDLLFCGPRGGEPVTKLSQMWRRVKAAAGRFFSTTSDLALLYIVRDNVLASTPGGRRASELYRAHQAELRRLLLADASLRERTLDVLTAWRPVLSGLAGLGGDSIRITSGQIADLQSLLAELRAAGSPALRGTIDREAAAIGLASFTGLKADQAMQRLNRLSCVPGPETLCLTGGRFRVETAWETLQGQRGAGRAVALTPETGYFWFFSPDNVEAVVKVLDACPVNRRRWVFAGGLTSVRVVLTVTDTESGAVRTYVNPQGKAFQPVQDTGAFVCE